MITMTGIFSANSASNVSPSSQRKQYSQDLASSLESGNLTGAQSAFAQLLQLNTSQQTSTGQSGGKSLTNATIDTDFQALKSALASNDLTGAKSAFATLQKDTQSLSPSQASSLQPSGLAASQLSLAMVDSYLQQSGNPYTSRYSGADTANAAFESTI